MGALFSGPKAAPLPPLPEPDPDPETLPDPAEEALEARRAAQERRQRGRAGTVLTSWRGVLTERPDLPKRKTLLGE